jgi:hypothetical protein
MASPLADLFASLRGVMDELKVSWYVFDAQAAIMHGATRLTADVDITVDLRSVPLTSLVSALEKSGFTARVADISGFVARSRVLPMVETASRIPVDLILAGTQLEEDVLRRSRVHIVEGVSVPVASAEDVILMKLLAGRSKDLDDVLSVLAANLPALDLAALKDRLAALEAALDRRDLRSTLSSLLDRARRIT